jgi:hypothetical protein
MAICSFSSLGPGDLGQLWEMMGMGMGAFDIYRDLLWAGFISHGGQREGTGYLRLLTNAFWMMNSGVWLARRPTTSH